VPHLVRDLEADGGFARDHFHDAYRDHAESARQVLGQVGNLRRLDARRRLQFETRDHRARVHFDHVDLHPEIRQLEFDLTRQRLQHLGAVAGLLLGRVVQQIQRRQVTGRQVLEQRLLFFLDGALAGLAVRRDHLRLDARLGLQLLALGVGLAGFLAPGLGAAAGSLVAHAHHRAPDPGDGVQGMFADHVHHAEPGQVREQGQAEQEQRQQEQRRAEHAGGLHQRHRELLADDAPAPGRQRTRRRRGMQVRQAGRRQHEQQETRQPCQPFGPGGHLGRTAIAGIDQPAGERQQQRKRVGQVTGEKQQHVGQPGAQHAAGILHLVGRDLVERAGVGRVVRNQAGQQVDGQEYGQDEGGFAEPLGDGIAFLSETFRFLFSLRQTALPCSVSLVEPALIFNA